MQMPSPGSVFHPRRPWLWLVLLLLVYALAGFLLVPWLLRQQIVGITQERLSLATQIERIAFNPFTFVLRIESLDVREPDGGALLAFDELFVNFETISLFRWAWSFDEVHLVGLAGRIERFSANETNLSRLAKRWAATADDEPEPPPEPEEGGPPRLVVADLRLVQGAMDMVDHVPATTFETRIGPVDLAIANLSTLPDATGNQEVVIALEDGARVRWSGGFDLDPLRARGRLAVSGPHLPLIYRYLQDQLAFELPSGDLDLQLDYRLAMGPEGAIEASVDNLALAVTELQVRDPVQGESVLDLERFQVTGGSLLWPEATARVEEVRFAGASVLARRDADGVLNLARLAGVDPAAPEAPSDTTPEAAGGQADPSWAVSAGALVLEGWQITFDDQGPSAGARFVTALEATVTELGNQPDVRSTVEARLELADGGVLTASGEATLMPSVLAQVDVALEGLALRAAQPYVSEVMRATIDEGRLGLSGTVSVTPEEVAGFTGTLSVDELAIQDPDREERLLAWQRLNVDGVRWSTSQSALDVSEIVLDAPYARLDIAEDGTTNVSDLLVETEEAPQPAPEPESESEEGESAPLRYSLGRVRIDKGGATFRDQSLPLPFTAEIAELAGEISTFASDSDEPARIDLAGRVDEYGEVRIEGAVRASAPEEYSRVDLHFGNLDMPAMSPYVIKFAGREIADGRLDADLSYQIEGERLVGENGVVIREFQLGRRVDHPDAMDLPLGLAVALLTDANGVIDIDVPVQGDLNDPQFSYGAVIRRALVNLITSAVSSPFRLLAGLVGAEGDSLQDIRFEPGRDGLGPPEQQKLDKLAEALAQRPALRVRVPPVVAPEADRRALQAAQLDAAIEARLAEQGDDERSVLAERRRALLESLYEEAELEPALDELRAEHTTQPSEDDDPVVDVVAYADALRRRLLERQLVPDGALEALADARAAAVIRALTPGEEATSRVARGDRAQVEVADGRVAMSLEATAAE